MASSRYVNFITDGFGRNVTLPDEVTSGIAQNSVNAFFLGLFAIYLSVWLLVDIYKSLIAGSAHEEKNKVEGNTVVAKQALAITIGPDVSDIRSNEYQDTLRRNNTAEYDENIKRDGTTPLSRTNERLEKEVRKADDELERLKKKVAMLELDIHDLQYDYKTLQNENELLKLRCQNLMR